MEGLTKLVTVIRLGNGVVGLESSNVVNVEPDRLSHPLLPDTLARLLALSLRLLKVGLVDLESRLLCHQHGEVDGETIGVVQSPDVDTSELLGARGLGSSDVGVEELLSSVERAGERLLLFVEDLLQVGELASDFGEEVTLETVRRVSDE